MLWLERKYLSMCIAHLGHAKWKNENTLNHRCPYCGDSKKNQYKARGYHFVVEQNFVYKCHNCGKATSSVHFMKDHFPTIHRDYLKEWLTEQGVKPKPKKLLSANEYKFTPQQDLLNISVETLKAVCWPAWDKIVSREYLQNRKIPDEKIEELWYVNNSQYLSNLSEKYKDRVLGNDPRIVLPFFAENGELVGVSGRAMNDSPLRYLTMKFLEDVPLIYNLNKVDKTKTIYVTEGPIDSLFLPNSIAVGGSDFKKLDDSIKDNAVIIFDNEPRSKEIIKKLEEVIDLGYKVVIWHNKRVNGLKDINDMIMDGLSQTNVLDIINTSIFDGLSAKLKLMEYKKT
jgi:DNA-directed RNA polymerase subunit RPC12/RpoP